MDYEVILLHRIQEPLHQGQSMKDAVRSGVSTTGAMITGAGMIMVIVFISLLISPLAVMKTLALGLTFAVLMDTWIVRSLMVPSITVLLGRFAYWPWG
jgi:RND superfamily putative drug exporter